MRNTLLRLLGAALIAASAMQAASAHERHHTHKVERLPAPISQTVRDSNAHYWPAQPPVPDWYRYSEGGAISAPAGR
jgi:hypothetical protein